MHNQNFMTDVLLALRSAMVNNGTGEQRDGGTEEQRNGKTEIDRPPVPPFPRPSKHVYRKNCLVAKSMIAMSDRVSETR